MQLPGVVLDVSLEVNSIRPINVLQGIMRRSVYLKRPKAGLVDKLFLHLSLSTRGLLGL